MQRLENKRRLWPCSKFGTVHSGWNGEEGYVPLRKPKESGRRESCEKISFPVTVDGVMPYLCNDWGGSGASGLRTWAKGSVAPVLTSESASSLPGRTAWPGPTGSLELHGRRGSRRESKYPRRTLIGETSESWKEGQGPIGSEMS